MPIIKFVNESEKIEYSTEQDVCSLLCYAFDPQKTIMNDNQFVGCKPFGFPFWYIGNVPGLRFLTIAYLCWMCSG